MDVSDLSGRFMVDFNVIQSSLARADRFLGTKEALREERLSKLRKLENECKDLIEEISLLTRVDQVLLAVSSRVLGQSTTMIDKLVTSGLRITFDDQQLEFRAKVDRYRGKTSVVFDLFQDGHLAPIMDSYGGGVLVVAGVLLRVVVIIALKMRRVLLLDESLSHLSEAYIPNASRLLKKLCDELNFTIVMVSHQTGFAEYADCHFEAVRGSREEGTKIRLVKGKSKAEAV